MSTVLSPEGFYFTEDDGTESPDNSASLGISSAAYDNNPLVPNITVPQATSQFDGENNLILYEDDDYLYNYFVYDANKNIISFLETDKKTNKMIQHVFTPTGKNITSSTANEVDHQTRSELFGDIHPTTLEVYDRNWPVDETDAAKTYEDVEETLIPIAAIIDDVLIPE